MSDPERSRPASAYEARATQLVEVLREQFGVPGAARTVIAVAGESGSGKSVTATDLAAELNANGVNTAIIHQDNYFIRPPRSNHEHRLQHGLESVGPQEVQLDLIRSQMAAFRAGERVEAPVVDYPGNQFVSQSLNFASAQILIVEGTYALLIDGHDIGIFLQATWQDTAERRRVRNRDIDDPMIDSVLAHEHRLIAPQASRAAIVLDRDFVISVK